MTEMERKNIVAWWRKRCRENPGLGATPEEQIAYFRELDEDYANCLQKLLINESEDPPVPEGVYRDIE